MSSEMCFGPVGLVELDNRQCMAIPQHAMGGVDGGDTYGVGFQTGGFNRVG
jgi:hypothetical protein